MTAAFDPYHKWLGISPQDQPPNHYRLLGVEVFESDPDVISNAADGRMAQVKNFQSGKHSAVSQRILNEIAAAKVCLLNAGKKAEYDLRLREQLASQQAAAADAVVPPAPPATFGVPAETLPLGIPDLGNPVGAYTARTAAARKKKRNSAPPWPLFVGVGAVVLALAGLLAYLLVPGDGDTAARSKPTHAEKTPGAAVVKEPIKTETAKPAPAKPAGPKQKPPEETPLPKTEQPEKTIPPEEKPAEQKSRDVAPNEAEKTETKTEEPQAKAKPQEKPPEPPADKRLPVPGDAQQKAAEQKVREVFKKEYADRSIEGRQALALKLSEQASAGDNDPQTRFVLRRLAAEALLEADPAKAFEQIDRIAEQYQVEGLGMKADLVSTAAEQVRPGPAAAKIAAPLADAAMKLSDTAIQEDDFEAAAWLLKHATALGHKAKDAELVQEARSRTQRLDAAKKKYLSARKALDTLKQDPADENANLEAGRWHCYQKGDWEKGLPLLAKGSQPALADLAKRDLARPTEAKKQAELADAWWARALAEKMSPPSRAIQLHAAQWYEKALPGLPSLDKKRVEERLAGLTAEAALPGQAGGVVQRGNVALASNGTTIAGAGGKLDLLLDGNSTKYDPTGGYAYAEKFPSEWTVTFKTAYRLREVRLLLYDVDQRKQNYRLLVSADGQKFVPLVDRSLGQWFGWQKTTFPPRPVKAIKLVALNSTISSFCAVELEAYCVPPTN
jgi:hypothetical protein